MQKVDRDCGPRFIGEAIHLEMEEIAIATPDGNGLFVVKDSSRVSLKDVVNQIEIHLFLPREVEEQIPSTALDSADSITYCDSVQTRLIADADKVYIRNGTFNRDRSDIITTGRDHRCAYDAQSPSEFMHQFLTLSQ